MTKRDEDVLKYCFENSLEAIKMGNYEGHFFAMQQMAKIAARYLSASPSRQ